MFEFNVETCIDFPIPQTRRARELVRLFGLRSARIKQQRLLHRCRLAVYPGDIIYITGPSGAGKSVLLEAMYEQAAANGCTRLEQIELSHTAPAIDGIDEPIFAATETFTRAGLGDVFCMLQTPSAMSVGQQHRYRLLLALAGSARFIFADEFSSTLDRISARSVAYHLRRRASRSEKIFVLASSHEDILADLQPDVLIVKHLNGRMHTHYTNPKRCPMNQYIIDGKRYPVLSPATIRKGS